MRGEKFVKKVPKVGAFIIRSTGKGRQELLLFTHPDFPEAPIQIPGGGIEPGESVEAALAREIEEECGLTGLPIERKLGVSEVSSIQNKAEILERHCFLLRAPKGERETWIHRVKGSGLDQDLRFEFHWRVIAPDFTLTGDLGFFLSPEHIPELYQ